jgi:energy-coupling factor transporter ATP-binding protein EcfA2
MTNGLDLLSFERLAERAERKAARATARKGGWQRVVATSQALAGGDRDDGLLSGAPWALVEVQIENYQGVTSMDPLIVDPTPGVTVLLGENGSGKTSLAEGIETALVGRPRPRTAGSGGKSPLWDRSHCARDADEASVRLLLARGSDRLELSVRLDRSGEVVDRSALLHTSTGTTTLKLDETPWLSAVKGRRPVFAYASVERQVQLAKDLQEFLEPMLALGGCFEELRDRIRSEAEEPTAAETRWRRALDAAREQVSHVDRQYDDGTGSLPELAWPAISDDPEAWTTAVGLTERGELLDSVAADVGSRLQEAADAVLDSLRELQDVESTTIARLAAPLHDLNRAAADLDLPGNQCPVCAEETNDWRSTLKAALAELHNVATRETTFHDALSQLRILVGREMPAIVQVVEQSWFDPQLATDAYPVVEGCRALVDTVRRDGLRSVPSVRTAARAAATALRTESWAHILDEVVERSGRRNQWSRARRYAIEEFLAVWTVDGPSGAAAQEWQEAEQCLRELQTALRDERTDRLQQRTDETVRELLADVGMHVEKLKVQGTKATLRILDDGGKSVELAMLSAGQRNALLLAPLLAMNDAGPFGFLVLDDPVHAFDQVRVDRLAGLIAELASRRRVVVFTHDARLAEHLATVADRPALHEVVRDARTGAIRHEESVAAWEGLVADARNALRLAADGRHGTTVTPTDLVRGYCRMAVDAAVRLFVIERARVLTRDVDVDLAMLDGRSTTDKRLKAAETMHPGAAVDEARRLFDLHSVDWNRASHGNPAISEAGSTEIDDAEQLCRALVEGVP